MTPQELAGLRTGIAKLFEAGATSDEIYSLLLERGWEESDILTVLDSEAEPEPVVIRSLPAESPETQPPVAAITAERPVRLSRLPTLFLRAFSLSLSRFGNLFIVLLVSGIISAVIFTAIYFFAMAGGIAAIVRTATMDMNIAFIITPLIVLGLLIILFLLGGLQMILPAALIAGFGEAKQSIGKNIKQGLRRAYPLFWVIILTGLFMATGTVFFIVPGIIFALWFYFAPAIIVHEKVSPFSALLLSRELVRGRVLAILLRVLTFFLLTVAFAIVCLGVLSPLSFIDSQSVGVGIMIFLAVATVLVLLGVFFSIFSFAFYGALYQELRALKPSAKPSRKLGNFLVGFLIVGFSLTVIAGLIFSSSITEMIGNTDFAIPAWLRVQ